jgi:glyoxylase-like metal-dependent hydrolase (beta-lactamase superfamily II)
MQGQAENIFERISEVVPGIFRIVVPLPIPDVESINSYVIIDDDRNLIVDPGMADPACYEIMEKAMGALGLDLGRTDFFITHHHLDHFGAVSKLLSGTSKIYISKPEAEFIERIASGEAETETAALLEMMGFPEKNPMFIVSQFFGNEYKQRCSWPFCYVADGDLIKRGVYNFTGLVAPGHSMAHSCLYESNRHILISGDQITAGIQFLLDRNNPLTDHFQSLDRLRGLEVNLTLPGHGSPFKDHRKKIDYLRAHHQGRLDAICASLGEDGKDAFEMTLALDGRFSDRDRINTLPPIRVYIHTRHTYAYLLYLTTQGQVRKENRHGRILFFRCRPVESERDKR